MQVRQQQKVQKDYVSWVPRSIAHKHRLEDNTAVVLAVPGTGTLAEIVVDNLH